MGFDCFEHDGGRCGWGTVWMGTALNKFDLIGCVFYWAGTAPGGTAWGTAFPNIRTVWSEVSTLSPETDADADESIRYPTGKRASTTESEDREPDLKRSTTNQEEGKCQQSLVEKIREEIDLSSTKTNEHG